MWCQSPPVFARGVESCDRQWPGSLDECARRERLQRLEQEHLGNLEMRRQDQKQLEARRLAMEDYEEEELEEYYQRESFHWAMLSDDELARASTAAVGG